SYSVFFFQAEDGIRDFHVTGVQTCALPIYEVGRELDPAEVHRADGAQRLDQQRLAQARSALDQHMTRAQEGGEDLLDHGLLADEIGRAACRERVWNGKASE